MSGNAAANAMALPVARRPVAWARIARTVAAAGVAGIFILPILWWGLASFKPTQEILSVPPKLFGFEPTFNWYRVVLGNDDPTKFNLESTGSVGRATAQSSESAVRLSCFSSRRPPLTRCPGSRYAGARTWRSGSSPSG